MTNSAGATPLERIVVLDFTQILAGPFCTQMLADAGARVIKVEPPGGDFNRVRGWRRTNGDGHWITGPAAAVNRGKESIALDLKNPDGVAIALRLAAKADVVIENFAPGTLDRLGIKFAELRRERPELVTCSISLFGGFERAGDLARRLGLAVIAEAESSLASMQQDRDGTPLRLGLPLGDMCAGLAAYGAILTALYDRRASGLGRHLDISMVGTLLACNATAIATEQISGPDGPYHGRMPAGWGFFPAADGHVAIGVNGDAIFARVAAAMDEPQLSEDPRYATNEARDARIDEVEAMMADWTRTRTARDIVETMTAYNVPCGVVATPGDVLDGELAKQLDLLEEVGDSVGGTVRTPVSPHGFRSATPAVPRVHEHGAAVLAELLDVSAATYEELDRGGAFGQR